jgi:glycosyltransferase involved in cell wall biosynthesis
MRVLHINLSDYARGGGGAIAVHRLHKGLQKDGIDSHVLSSIKTLESADSTELPRSRRLESALRRVTRRLGLNDLHAVNSFQIKNHPLYQKADVLHFHVIHSGYFNFLALPRLTMGKPSVFTHHDMWAFTGHCIYSYDCERWKTGCGKCPYPDRYPNILRDNTRLEWKLKKSAFSRSKLMMVSPSQWMTRLAKESILKEFPFQHIPHGIDTEIFKPLDREQCKAVLSIPKGKHVILFVADGLSDQRKGMDLLMQALQKLPALLKRNCMLLTFGNGGESISELVEIESRSLGFITDDRLKSVAYSAADIFVSPTRADNSPLTLIESVACGVPMVAFDVGGVSEIVRNRVTGTTVPLGDVVVLAESIREQLEDDHLRKEMSRQCREIAIQEYELELHVRKYSDLYSRSIESRN